MARHRVSLVHGTQKNATEALSPSYVRVSDDVPFVREDRYNYELSNIANVRTLRVHIEKGHDESPLTAPFSYRYQIGLHFYVKPVEISSSEDREEFYNHATKAVADIFGVSPRETQWVHSLNSLYFHVPEILAFNQDYLPEKSMLRQPWSSLDFWYDNGHASLKVFLPIDPIRHVNASTTADFIEVGIFAVASESTPDDATLVGARLLYNDEDPDPNGNFVHRTLFHVKPRHRDVPHADIRYVKNGLHPKVVFENVPDAPVADDISRCSLYAYLTLEKSVFLDPFQLPDGINVVANYGTRDLELPEYLVNVWGNEVLLEVTEDAILPLDLTLHTRYQNPSRFALYNHLSIDKPVLFYACESRATDAQVLKASPFDNKRPVGGNYEKFFTDDTVFFHALDRGQFSLDIPTLSLDKDFINTATLSVVCLGFFLILIKSFFKFRSRAVSPEKKSQ